MKNIDEVRKELAEVFSNLKSGVIEPPQAKEMNNCAGKIISSCKVQLEYQHLKGQKVSIPFLAQYLYAATFSNAL